MPKAPVAAAPENPYAFDLLGRGAIVTLLREVIAETDAPISIGLAAPWGSGKSSVLNILAADLRKRNLPWLVCRFDAWANEDVGDPILGLTEEITEGLKVISPPLTSRLRKNLSRIAGDIAELTLSGTAAAAAMTAFATPFEDDKNMKVALAATAMTQVAKVVKKASDVRRERLAADVKVARFKYREEIQSAVRTVRDIMDGGGCKILVVVDDLDRCNPNFALKTLERMKHFFDIPGVSFILAYDPAYIRSAAQAIYGIALDAERYFRRFVDFEFGLPQPDMTRFVQGGISSLGLTTPFAEFETFILELVTHVRPVMEPRDVQSFLSALMVARRALKAHEFAYTIVPPLLASRFVMPDAFASAIRTNGPFQPLLMAVTKLLEGSKHSLWVARLNAAADAIDMPAGWLQQTMHPNPPTPPPQGVSASVYASLREFTAHDSQPARVGIGELLRFVTAAARIEIRFDS